MPQWSPDDFYRKLPNGRYEHVGREFRGKLADGLWLIQNDCCSMAHIANYDQLTAAHSALTLGALMKNRDKACIAVSRVKELPGGFSNLDIVNAVIAELLSD